jgi:hypothetical protein
MANKQITVLAALSQDALELRGADVEDTGLETVASAKQRARYVLTEEYRRITEASERLGYAQVVVNGEVVADYFGEVR